MTDKTTDAAIDYPINQQLIEEASRCREEWRVLKDRLAKIEGHKKQVSPEVYESVRKDYEKRIQEATTALLAKKGQVDKELATLSATQEKIAAQLDEHRKKMEEIKFRHMLSEYSEEEYQDKAHVEQEKISKFETVANAVAGNIHRYESIFKEEEEIFASVGTETEAAEELSDVAEVSGIGHAPPHEREPETDAAGYVIEEGGPDYFSAGPSAPEATNPEIEQSATSKVPPTIKSPGKATPQVPTARVSVVTGDGAGTVYPLKGTVSFGRAESNTVVIKDAKVSRQHAQIQQHGKEYIIVDLNSSNGTFVNGERIEEHVLAEGDEIQIGETVFRFQA